MSENARDQVWDEKPAYLDWEALITGLPPGGQSGQVLVFSAQSGDWKWAPRPDAPLAAEKEPDEGTVRRSVADFLRSGLRSLQTPANDGAPPHWHEGYLEGSKRLARDLCRHLDIAWDDKANEPKKGA